MTWDVARARAAYEHDHNQKPRPPRRRRCWSCIYMWAVTSGALVVAAALAPWWMLLPGAAVLIWATWMVVRHLRDPELDPGTGEGETGEGR